MMGIYNFQIIDDIEAFKAIHQEIMTNESGTDNIILFNSFEWLGSWWEAYSTPENSLLVLLCRKDHDLIALAPFYLTTARYYGLPRRMIQFIATGNSDRGDIIYLKDLDEHFFEEMLEYLSAQVKWDVLSLREIPENSPLIIWANKYSMAHVEKDSDCPYIPFDKGVTVESFRLGVSKKLRREFSNMFNRLKKEGEHKFVHRMLQAPDDPLLVKLKEIEQQSSKASGDIHLVFSPQKNFLFQQLLLKNLFPKVKVMLTSIELNREIVSYLYGFIFRDVYHAYNMAYLPEYARFSPGKLNMQEAIDECIRMNLKEFDFLRGNSYIKSKWADQARPQYHLTIFRKSLLNRIHSWLIFSIRPAVKKTITAYKHNK